MIANPSAQVVRWFAPPRLTSLESTHRARVLWKISWSFFGLITAALLVASLASPGLLPRRLTSIVLVGALVLLLHSFNRRGRTALASWLLVLGLTAIVTQRAWNTGGVHAPVALFYTMFIVLAGGLLGKRGSIITAAACVISATVLCLAEVTGLLTPSRLPASTTTQPFLAAVFAVTMTIFATMLLLPASRAVATEDLVDMFVYAVRSPLTVVMARLAILRWDLGGDTDALHDVDAALAETSRLSRMATNLLDSTRLASARSLVERTPFDVSLLASEVAQAVAAQEPSRQIVVRAPAPAVCRCDPDLIRRIVENLLANAVRHTATDRRIVVEVTAAEHRVRLAVEDDGEGISVKERERIFESYSPQGMRTCSGYHCVDLGLAFCKLAVTAHGGRIRVQAAHPHGSRFVVELPG